MKQIMIIAVSLLAGFGGGVVGARLTRAAEGDRPPRVVRARSFELVDETGKAISIWGVSKQGHALLAFMDYESEQGEKQEHSPGLDDPLKLRTAIGVAGSLSFLTFRGDNGGTRMNLYLDAWQKPLLWMGDETGRTRVGLGINHSDTQSAEDDDWALSFEPNRAWIGMSSQPEGGQRYVRGVFSVSKDKVKFP
jgi:hypothetical protein